MKLRKPFDFSFTGLVRQCQTPANRSSRYVTVANNCTAELCISGPGQTPGVRPDYSIVFRLHGHVIAVLSDHQVTLYDGGHRTNTTKDRLADILRCNSGLSPEGTVGELGPKPRMLFQRNWVWYVRTGYHSDPDGYETEFESGMTLRPAPSGR